MNPDNFTPWRVSPENLSWINDTLEVLTQEQQWRLLAALADVIPEQRPDTLLQSVQRDIMILKILCEYLLP